MLGATTVPSPDTGGSTAATAEAVRRLAAGGDRARRPPRHPGRRPGRVPGGLRRGRRRRVPGAGAPDGRGAVVISLAVDGSPSGCRQAARDLRVLRTRLATLADEVAVVRTGSAGAWTGLAGERFRTRTGSLVTDADEQAEVLADGRGRARHPGRPSRRGPGRDDGGPDDRGRRRHPGQRRRPAQRGRAARRTSSRRTRGRSPRSVTPASGRPRPSSSGPRC